MSFASLVEPEPHDSWSEEESSEERSVAQAQAPGRCAARGAGS